MAAKKDDEKNAKAKQAEETNKTEEAQTTQTGDAAKNEQSNRAEERRAREQDQRNEQIHRQEDRAAREQDREVNPADQPLEATNPITTEGMQANYDPSGQINQPGQPLHSTDPEEQVAYEQKRREAVARATQGDRLTEEEQAAEDARQQRIEERRENA